MLALLRRHLILVISCLFCVILVLIGWSVRPDMAATPVDEPPTGETPAPSNAPDTTGESSAATIPHAEESAAGSAEPFSCADTYLAEIDDYLDNLDEDEADTMIGQLLDYARGSSSARMSVLAAQLTDSADERFALLRDAVARNPGDAHVLWTAVNRCLLIPEPELICPEISDWVETLKGLDSENTLVWAVDASLRNLQGDPDGALEAIRRGAVAYETHEYWSENVLSAREGLDALGGTPEIINIYSSIGFAAAFPMASSHYFLCREMAGTSVEWAESCLALGENIENSAKTYLLRGVGAGIQRQALLAQGYDENSARVQALPTLEAPGEEEYLRYPDSPAMYFDTFVTDGEIAAYENIRSVNRQRENAGYRPDCGSIVS